MFEFEIYKINVVEQKFELIGKFEPLETFSFSQKLNGIGKAEFIFSLDNYLIKDNLLRRYGTCILIKYNEEPVDVYFVRDLNYLINEEVEEVKVFCLSWLGHLVEQDNSGRFTKSFVRYEQVFQQQIVFDLINYTQNLPNGWLGIIPGNYSNYNERDRTYEYYNIGQAIINLSNVIGGFDFCFRPVLNNNKKLESVALDLYSTKGELKNNLNKLSLETNLNFLNIKTTNSISNYILGIGAGSNETFTHSEENQVSQEVYTRREKILDLKDISLLNTLKEKVNFELNKSIVENVKIDLKLIYGVNPGFFDFEVGDFLLLEKNKIFKTDIWLRVLEKELVVTNNNYLINLEVESIL